MYCNSLVLLKEILLLSKTGTIEFNISYLYYFGCIVLRHNISLWVLCHIRHKFKQFNVNEIINNNKDIYNCFFSTNLFRDQCWSKTNDNTD